jgi:hypothetical protein
MRSIKILRKKECVKRKKTKKINKLVKNGETERKWTQREKAALTLTKPVSSAERVNTPF